MVDPYPRIETWALPSGAIAGTLAAVTGPGHRGVESGAFWLGRRASRSVVDTVVIPSGPGVDEQPGFWKVGADVYDQISRWAGPQQLSLLGILHTHPGQFPPRLSPVDRTQSVRAPGVLAVVVGCGRHDDEPADWGWYVFQNDDYRLLEEEDWRRRVTIVDGSVSLLRANLHGVEKWTA